MADLVWSDPDPDKEDFAISPRLVIFLFTIHIPMVPVELVMLTRFAP